MQGLCQQIVLQGCSLSPISTAPLWEKTILRPGQPHLAECRTKDHGTCQREDQIHTSLLLLNFQQFQLNSVGPRDPSESGLTLPFSESKKPLQI